MRLFKHGGDVLDLHVFLTNKPIEYFFCSYTHVHIASPKHLGVGGILENYSNTLTAFRFCITVMNSPNTPCVTMRVYKCRKGTANACI